MKFKRNGYDYRLHANGLLIGDKFDPVQGGDGRSRIQVKLDFPRYWPGNWPYLIAVWYERRKGLKIIA